MYTPRPQPAPRPRLRWRLARAALLLAVVNGSTWALLDDDPVARLGSAVDRAGRRVSETTTEVRLDSADDRLARSRQAFDEMLADRETLRAQVQALEAQRAAILARLGEDRTVLYRASTEADEAELDRSEVALRRLTEDLARLDREVDRAARVLRQQGDDLGRQRADWAGRRAYQDALDRSARIGPPGR